MSTACQVCTAPAQAYLCPRCVCELRDMLRGLIHRDVPTNPPRSAPGWIHLLAQAAVGQVRLGDGGKRCGPREPLEAARDVLIRDREHDQGIGDARVDTDRPDPELLVRLLTAGRVNPRACDALDMLTNMLGTWVRDLCELDVPRHGGPVPAARWLAANIHAIASHQGAGEFYDELAERIKAIERIINRPTPPLFIGPCPTQRDRRRCATALRARRGAIEVTCPSCNRTHNVAKVQTQLLNEVEHYRFIRSDLARVLAWIDEPVPRQTMHDWIRRNRLPARGYLRAVESAARSGRPVIGLTRRSDDDQPVYRLGDARRLRAAAVERKAKVG